MKHFLIGIPMAAKSLKSVYNTSIIVYEYDDVLKVVINTYTYTDSKIICIKNMYANKNNYRHVQPPDKRYMKINKYFSKVITEYDTAYTGTTSEWLVFTNIDDAITSNILLLKNLWNLFNKEVNKVIAKRDKHFASSKMKIIQEFEEENPEYFV